MNAVIIASARARRGKEAFETFPKLLRERGVDVIDTILVDGRKELDRGICAALRDHKESCIVVCGGDGTLSKSIGHFVCRERTMGTVPAGTGNSFTRGLGIESFEAAADAIAFGKETRIDVGRIDGKAYFSNFACIGLDATIARKTSKPVKKVLGDIAYGAVGLLPLLRYKPFKAKLRWKGHKLDARTAQIIVSCGRYYGLQPISEDANPRSGELTVFLRDASSTIDMLQTYLALVTGKQKELKGVHLWSTPHELKIRTSPKVRVQLDGSDYGKTPVRFELVPKAVRVMVPDTVAVDLAS
jgi:YegS/Rv2252/BmrU family lipid kinase